MAGSRRSPRRRRCWPRPPTTSWPSLVGRDRGFRGLPFEPASELEVEPVATSVDGLTLELDGEGRPRGWRNGQGVLPTEGTWSVDDTLRTVADLVILSPAGAAVRVDGEGRADGVVRHGSLAEHVRRRQLSRAETGGGE